jgi:N utilization substance protein B
VPARSKARKRALDVLFEADQRGRDLVETLGEWIARADPPVPAYAEELVRGVAGNAAAIDEMLTERSQEWPLDRMPAVDRSILRLAAYELVYCPDIPIAVAIDEAVTLAQDLSTDESPRYVNGVLAALTAQATQRPTD